MRVTMATFYLLFAGGGLSFGLSLLHTLSPTSQLSETCKDHSCMCQLQGFCELSCCCSGDEELDGDGPFLVGCGFTDEDSLRIIATAPHLMPEVQQSLLIQEIPRTFKPHDYWFKTRSLEPPDKIPIAS